MPKRHTHQSYRLIFLFLAAIAVMVVTHATAQESIAVHVGPASAYPVPGTGIANPAVTQGNIKQTVCVKNWTKTIRPPASYTDKLKSVLMVRFHMPGNASIQ